MLYHSIFIKSHLLDEEFKKNENISYVVLSEFLDSIIFVASQSRSIEQLDNLYVIFRKWKIITNFLHSEKYSKTIDEFSSLFSQPKIPVGIPHFVETINKLRVTSSPVLMDKLTTAIEPYFTFYENAIRVIDPIYFKKRTVENLINEGVKYFKISKLKSAERNFLKAIRLLRQKNELDYNELYLHSWALHGLGNIEVVKNNFEIAYYLFKESYDIKKTIPNLPKLFIFSTLVKVETYSLIFLELREWYNNLYKTYVIVKDESQNLADENSKWYYNILADIEYQIGKSLFYLNKPSESMKFITDAIKITKEFNDKPGMLRCYILTAFITKDYNTMIRKIRILFDTFSEVNVMHPYIRHIISPLTLKEIEIINKKFKNSLKDLFSGRGIEPL